MAFSLKEAMGACGGCGNSYAECECGVDTAPISNDCPECGAPAGLDCDPGCPNADMGEFEPASGVFKKHDHLPEMDETDAAGEEEGDVRLNDPFKNVKRLKVPADDSPDSMPFSEADNEPVLSQENVTFDKYMDKILIQEGHNRVVKKQVDSPQRLRAAKHQDRPLNKTRFGSK